MDKNTMAELAFSDLDAASDRMYVAALRYVRAFERDNVVMRHGECNEKINVGSAGQMLVEAADQYSAAYERAENSGAFSEDAA
jgi:hypothetical protein